MAIVVPATSAALLTAALAYIGYFGGALFEEVPATGVPTREERGVAVVSLSGDMGFKVGMGPAVAKRIAAHGLPVIGINSLLYFRDERTAEDAARLLSAAIGRALALPGVDHVVLLGQSFGADMLQRALPLVPRAQRDRVIMVGLTVPGDTIEFKAAPGGLWSPGVPAVPGRPSAILLDWVPVICIYGQDETDSLCPAMTMANVRRFDLPGGHPLHRDVDRVAAILIEAIDRIAAQASTKADRTPPVREAPGA